jgi:beta-1,2-mannobiose phosphorylase / 1,2-beta-oligomannan phosphorylase
MKTILTSFIFFSILVMPCCKNRNAIRTPQADNIEFPDEMVSFVPFKENPVFEGTDTETWDRTIRERGFILYENGIYRLWYTGYKKEDNDPKSLGYATSGDGINWKRYSGNPIFSEKWTEDMFVLKHLDKYYMYAEGKNDVAHLLTSDNGISWQEQGDLIIRRVNGDTIPGPYGTPSVLIENGQWYLFYERNDEGIWLAKSDDHKSWLNVQDEPVLKRGPEKYDFIMLAANQVVKFKDMYYMYYHGLSREDQPDSGGIWTSNVARSADLIHWIKYPQNPVLQGDHSSPVIVFDGVKFRLYSMHPSVWLYFSQQKN